MNHPVPSGPHTHSGASLGAIMGWVLAALLPATLFGVYQFGWPAFNLVVVTLLTVVSAEAASLAIAGKPIRPGLLDGSAMLTGLLLVLSLPPWAPWWIAVLGGVFAIVVGKQVFGGIGQNVFNPAMLARVTLLVAFPLEMTTWVAPAPMFSEQAPDFFEGLMITFSGIGDIDAISSATTLGHVRTGFTQGHSVAESLAAIDYHSAAAGLGMIGGSLGETSALLLLAGGLVLLGKRIITWHIPLAMLGSIAVLASLFHLLDPDRYADAAYHLLSGGAMLGAFFIITDPVTSPSTPRGQLLFGAGCGVLVYIIRTWGGYPEGIGFAVLLMNAVAPLIDHYTRPRIFGRDRRGVPLRDANNEADKS